MSLVVCDVVAVMVVVALMVAVSDDEAVWLVVGLVVLVPVRVAVAVFCGMTGAEAEVGWCGYCLGGLEERRRTLW